MEYIKYYIKNTMGWLQVVNFECKVCGKQHLLKEEAEACYDSHKQ